MSKAKSLSQLKRAARKIQNDQGIDYQKALDQASKEAGFGDGYHEAQQRLSQRAAPEPVLETKAPAPKYLSMPETLSHDFKGLLLYCSEDNSFDQEYYADGSIRQILEEHNDMTIADLSEGDYLRLGVAGKVPNDEFWDIVDEMTNAELANIITREAIPSIFDEFSNYTENCSDIEVDEKLSKRLSVAMAKAFLQELKKANNRELITIEPSDEGFFPVDQIAGYRYSKEKDLWIRNDLYVMPEDAKRKITMAKLQKALNGFTEEEKRLLTETLKSAS